jgi:hypothetical protein
MFGQQQKELIMDSATLYSILAGVLTALVVTAAAVLLTDSVKSCRMRLAFNTDRDVESINALCEAR